MYYIMARFFVGWCDYNAYAHSHTLPLQFTARYSLDVLKPSNIGQKLILLLLLNYLQKVLVRWYGRFTPLTQRSGKDQNNA